MRDAILGTVVARRCAECSKKLWAPAKQKKQFCDLLCKETWLLKQREMRKAMKEMKEQQDSKRVISVYHPPRRVVPARVTCCLRCSHEFETSNGEAYCSHFCAYTARDTTDAWAQNLDFTPTEGL
jgi:hypothetical protein